MHRTAAEAVFPAVVTAEVQDKAREIITYDKIYLKIKFLFGGFIYEKNCITSCIGCYVNHTLYGMRRPPYLKTSKISLIRR